MQEFEAMDLSDLNSDGGGSNALRPALDETVWSLASERAEWDRSKQKSKVIKDTKTQNTRKRNRTRRMQDEADVPAAWPSGEQAANASLSAT